MKTTLVRYKLHEGKTDENEALVHAVFDELRETAPAGIRYTTVKLPDGVSFMHFAIVDTADGSNPLNTLESFKRFQAGIKERCKEPPVAVHATTTIESYGFA